MKKKWLFIIIFVIAVVIGIFAYFYMSIRSPIKEDAKRAVEYVLEHTEIVQVDKTEFYNGTRDYQVIFGKDKNGTEWIVWYNDEEKDVIKRKKADGLSEQDVLKIVKKELNIEKTEKIRLGIENRLPVYEVIYLEDGDRFAYYYLTFDDGTFVKRYSLKKE